MKRSWPAWMVLVLSLGYVFSRLSASGWDATALAEVGSRYAQGDPAGTEGYDGQFALFMALEPSPKEVALQLDVPAYRYQRILYPLLGRLVGFGRTDWIPWALLAVNIAAHTVGTFAVAETLRSLDRWPGYALLYGLWAGVIGGVGLVLHEPLAYALVALGVWARLAGRREWGAAALGAALFAKETTIVFVGAALLADLLHSDRRRALAVECGSLVAFGLWQVWLWTTFGQPGLGSGGAMATAFEWIPFMGLWRIAEVEPRVLAVYLLVFGPGILLPTVWALVRSGRDLLAGDGDFLVLALLLNSLVIVFLPHSTFREPLGLVRIATGLVISVVVYAAQRGPRRVFVYAWFWLAYLVLLI